MITTTAGVTQALPWLLQQVPLLVSCSLIIIVNAALGVALGPSSHNVSISIAHSSAVAAAALIAGML
jgi:hypothetical protein